MVVFHRISQRPIFQLSPQNINELSKFWYFNLFVIDLRADFFKVVNSFFWCSWCHNQSRSSTNTHHFAQQSYWNLWVPPTSQGIKSSFVDANVERFVSVGHSRCIYYLVLLQAETITINRAHLFNHVGTDIDVCDALVAIKGHLLTQFTVSTTNH